ncbi:MAG: long-chain fatty acid--CoA ligase [Candidatus Cloacimonetes bacterium HGW-Cloacimonetes-1]|jgi:long-chain acyl-CoA synthetase|nr:MAG: long-chain fatty acid--CoA ligase [Candidatus Cloacimonetes bacterium HGW-Cloacimonetes-1]
MIDEKLIPYLENSIKEYWDLPAFTNYPGTAMRYSEVAQQLVWMHRLFESCGINKGSKIALAGKNCSNWAVVWLSAITYGGTIVPILANFSPEDTQHIINHSDAELVFVSKDKYDGLDFDRMPKVKYLISLEDYTILDSKEDVRKDKVVSGYKASDQATITAKSFKLSDVCDNSDPGAIIYTSGTTGFSKGVILPHRSLLANLIVARENLLFKVGANVVSFLPLAHAYACSFDFLYPFSRGNHINFIDKMPTPKVLLGAIQALKPNVFLGVPLLIEKIYKKQLQPTLESGNMQMLFKIPGVNNLVYAKIRKKLLTAFGGDMKELIVGGAPMNAEVEHFMKKIKFPLTIGYGMTECGPLITYSRWYEHRFASSGALVKYLEVKIDSSDPFSIPGEILIRGEQVFTGYYKNEEATKEVLRDGWLYTGDIGTIDKDNFVYIKGRSKNVILGPSGENIYPELVEQKLNNLPYVLESLVLERDRQVVALIYPDLETMDHDKLPESKIAEIMEQNRKDVNKQLADFSRIARVQIVNEPFMKTPTQKIKRYLYS